VEWDEVVGVESCGEDVEGGWKMGKCVCVWGGGCICHMCACFVEEKEKRRVDRVPVISSFAIATAMTG
jgi:hypothetical protein